MVTQTASKPLIWLNLEYSAEKVKDFSLIGEGDEWLEQRRHGIGGSDVAALFNASHWKTNVDIYLEKMNIQPVIKEVSNWFTLEYGHVNEELVAKLFAHKTGYTVIQDSWTYRHPIFPFMQTNFDRRVILPDGRRALLEIKTATSYKKEDWKKGVPLAYQYQCRHQMAIDNCDLCFIACLFGNLEDDLVYYLIERDLVEEQNIILTEKSFWETYVEKKIPPKYTGDPELIKGSMERYRGNGNKFIPDVIFTDSLKNNFEEYFELEKQLKELKKETKEIETQMLNLTIPIVDVMNEAWHGLYNGTGYTVNVTYKPTSSEKVDKNLFKTKYPEVYKDIVTSHSEVSRPIKLRLSQSKYNLPKGV